MSGKPNKATVNATSTPIAKGSNVNKSRLGNPVKRTCGELSDTSIEEINNMSFQLEELNKEVKETKEFMKTLMSKEDIKSFISSTIQGIVVELKEKLHERVEELVSETNQELVDRLDSLVYENTELKEQLELKDARLNEFEERLKEAEKRSKDALQRANYNEQYSRKNNVKINGIQQRTNETTETLTEDVCALLQTKASITLTPTQIVAIHRIPGRAGQPQPVLIKLRNNNDKTLLMKNRRRMKEAGYKLVDDVTRLNTGLINRLLLNEAIESAWYFNGAVYGKSHAGRRYKFDIYDSIPDVMAKTRQNTRDTPMAVGPFDNEMVMAR